MVHETLLRKIALDVPDRRFAERADFKLFAERPREGGGPQFALPIGAAAPELGLVIARVVQQPDLPGHRALHRMPYVIHVERIAVRPSVQIAHAGKVAAAQTRSGSAGSLLRKQAKAVHCSQQPQRGLAERRPANSWRIALPRRADRVRRRGRQWPIWKRRRQGSFRRWPVAGVRKDREAGNNNFAQHRVWEKTTSLASPVSDNAH